MILSKDELDFLEKKYGSPFYVFDEKGFSDNFKELENAIKNYYSAYRIAYSYKTNYTPFIAKKIKELGGMAEVVSGLEYEIAKRIGYQDSDIIFNGPEKSQSGDEAFLNGCIVNADSVSELAHFVELAKRNPGKKFRIGIRINIDVGQPFISRFGIDETDIPRVIDDIRQTDNLTIVGIHCHISRCRGLEAWRKRAEIMLGISQRFFQDQLEFIDLGSGMYGTMEDFLKKQFDYVPTYNEYAQAVAKPFSDRFGRFANKPLLITEPGTTLVNRYLDFYGKVKSIKTVKNKQFAILNCSIHNLGEVCTLKQLPAEVISCTAGRTSPKIVDLVGYTCLEQDVIRKDFEASICEGDYIRFGNVGGYSTVLKPPFIKPNCAVLAKRRNGCVDLIKEAETVDSILKSYRFFGANYE